MYFPQSQIKTNLYTNGDEFVVKSTDQNYVGSYWKTSSGQFFSKKNPQDIPYEELIESITQPQPPEDQISTSILNFTNTNISPSSTSYNLDYSSVRKYDLLRGVDVNQPQVKKIPLYYHPQPTLDDYKLGAFTRYFCKRTNQDIYIEINKETFNGLLNANPEYLFSLYTPFQITWTLTGTSSEEVSKVNLSVVSRIERELKFRGLVRYFKNYSQFYQVS
jgi:hypothetical protein